MERNRLIARAIDGILLVGLTLYAAAVIVIAQRNIATPVQPLLVWCFVVWVGPSLARFLVIPTRDAAPSRKAKSTRPVAPSHDVTPPANRYVAYSDARDDARPPLWMLAARWLAVPALLGGVLFYLNGRVGLISSLVQALIVVVLFAAFFRGTIELVTFIATAILPTKSHQVRRRAERTWTLVYFVGLPLLLLSRYHS